MAAALNHGAASLMKMELVTVALDFPEDANIIFGQSHFIKVDLEKKKSIRERFCHQNTLRICVNST